MWCDVKLRCDELVETVCGGVCVCVCVDLRFSFLFTCVMFNKPFMIFQAASTSLGGITSTQPYDPRVKKHKLKPYDRKPRLDLLHSDPSCSSTSQGASASSSGSAVSVNVSGRVFHLLLKYEGLLVLKLNEVALPPNP